MNVLILSIPLFYLNIAQAFRINQNSIYSKNTHYPCKFYRNKPLELFDSCSKSLSRCPVYNYLSSNLSVLNKKVNEYVPGGWYTTVGLPFLSYFSFKLYSGFKKYFKREKPTSTLHRYQCMGCGYVIFPARNREEKFFTESFTCPNCGSPRSRFTDKYK